MAERNDPLVLNGKARPFLTAEWRNLVMVNYEVPPEVLEPWLPAGVELDGWEGKTIASIVAFEFLDTRVLGMAIPGHRNFHEVNLRFYVRRKVNGEYRLGVVFIRELVPRLAIAYLARCLYGERYRAVRMNGILWQENGGDGAFNCSTLMRYWWFMGRSYEAVFAQGMGEPTFAAKDSQAAFLTERAFGYSVFRGGTLEYEVEHPPWRVWDLSYVSVDCNVGRVFGEPFGEHLKEPCSSFIAEGSPVVVRWGRRLRA